MNTEKDFYFNTENINSRPEYNGSYVDSNSAVIWLDVLKLNWPWMPKNTSAVELPAAVGPRFRLMPAWSLLIKLQTKMRLGKFNDSGVEVWQHLRVHPRDVCLYVLQAGREGRRWASWSPARLQLVRNAPMNDSFGPKRTATTMRLKQENHS